MLKHSRKHNGMRKNIEECGGGIPQRSKRGNKRCNKTGNCCRRLTEEERNGEDDTGWFLWGFLCDSLENNAE